MLGGDRLVDLEPGDGDEPGGNGEAPFAERDGTEVECAAQARNGQYDDEQ
jgi:hypothetical protein